MLDTDIEQHWLQNSPVMNRYLFAKESILDSDLLLYLGAVEFEGQMESFQQHKEALTSRLWILIEKWPFEYYGGNSVFSTRQLIEHYLGELPLHSINSIQTVAEDILKSPQGIALLADLQDRWNGVPGHGKEYDMAKVVRGYRNSFRHSYDRITLHGWLKMLVEVYGKTPTTPAL